MKYLTLTAFLMGLLFVTMPSIAQEHHHAQESDKDTQSIIEVMQGMNENLQKLSGAILLEDYPLITSSANDIANHPGISKENLHQLFERLGSKKEAFIQCDSAVHHLALEVSEAGAQKNMDVVLEKYTAMITKAVECHKEYRPNTTTGNEE